MLRTLVASLIVGACVTTVAKAATGIGIGALPCSRWIGDQQDGVYPGASQTSADEAWLSGFLTGYAASNPRLRDALSEVDPDAAMASVNDYCRDHPRDQVVDAATVVANSLKDGAAGR
jgi:hypothetical protein